MAMTFMSAGVVSKTVDFMFTVFCVLQSYLNIARVFQRQPGHANLRAEATPRLFSVPASCGMFLRYVVKKSKPGALGGDLRRAGSSNPDADPFQLLLPTESHTCSACSSVVPPKNVPQKIGVEHQAVAKDFSFDQGPEPPVQFFQAPGADLDEP